MKPFPLRPPSPRPGLVTDQRLRRIVDDAVPQGTLGTPNPWGRGKLLTTLPLANGPRQLAPPTVGPDHDLAYLADLDGNLIGVAGIWVHKLLTATIVEDTRRL